MSLKREIILYIGLFLFIISPFLIFITPDYLYKDLLCDPSDLTIFKCAGQILRASTIVASIAFAIGSALMLAAFYIRPRK